MEQSLAGLLFLSTKDMEETPLQYIFHNAKMYPLLTLHSLRVWNQDIFDFLTFLFPNLWTRTVLSLHKDNMSPIIVIIIIIIIIIQHTRLDSFKSFN